MDRQLSSRLTFFGYCTRTARLIPGVY